MEALKNGIELTGTLFTSAQGEAKDKLAYAEQIWDNDLKLYLSDINKKRASLGEDNKILVSLLPSFKTINGKSIVGEGNIELDITLFRIVSSLPTTNIEANKIYLVLYEKGQEGNIYAEYVYVDGKWEELGKFQTLLDLSDYALKTEIPTKVSQLTNDSGFLTEHQDISGKVDKVEGKGLSTNDYTNSDKAKLDSILENAEENLNAYTSIIIHNKNGRDQVASATNKKCIFTLNAGKYLDGQVVGTNNLGLNVNIPFASTENEGLMSADDKSKVDNIDNKADISDLPNVVYEEITNSENAPEISEVSREELKKDLFIDLWQCSIYSSSLVYKYFKDTDTFGINFTPRTNKYLNAAFPYLIKDLSYLEALVSFTHRVNSLLGYASFNNVSRVNYIPNQYHSGSGPRYTTSTPEIIIYDRDIEVLVLASPEMLIGVNIPLSIINASNLKAIFGRLIHSSSNPISFTMDRESPLEYLTVELRKDFNISKCPNILLFSLLNMIEKAVNGITITVHPDVYAKIIDETNTEWNLLLIDAAAKNITFTTTE